MQRKVPATLEERFASVRGPSGLVWVTEQVSLIGQDDMAVEGQHNVAASWAAAAERAAGTMPEQEQEKARQVFRRMSRREADRLALKVWLRRHALSLTFDQVERACLRLLLSSEGPVRILGEARRALDLLIEVDRLLALDDWSLEQKGFRRSVLELERQRLHQRLVDLHLEPGGRFGGPPSDKEWAESFDETRRHGGRLARLERWELVGDLACSLYALVSQAVPAQRKRGLKQVTKPQSFNQAALEFVAQCCNWAFDAELNFSRRLKAADIKSRLQART